MYSTYTVVKLVYDEQNIMQIINIMFCVKPILTKEWHTKTAEASQWNSNLQLKLISLEPNTFLELGHKNWMSFDQVFSLQLRSRSWNENLEPPWWWLIVRGGRFIGKSSLFMSHGQQKKLFSFNVKVDNLNIDTYLCNYHLTSIV